MGVCFAPLLGWGQVPRFERMIEYGTQSWVRQAGMALDSADNLYVGGYFQDFVCFTDTCIAALGPDNTDMFVISFDPLGQMRWVKVFQEPHQQTMVDLIVEEGNVWLSVWEFYDSYDNDSVYQRVQQVNWRKLDLDGNVEHIERIEGTLQELGTHPMGISNGSLLIGGGTDEDSILLGGKTFRRDGIDSRDIFLARYHTSGILDTVWMFGSTSEGWEGEIYHLEVDQAGNIYLQGTFEENLIIGPDTLWSTTNTWNQADKYLVKLSPQGEIVWSRVGTPVSEMILDAQGRLIVTGNTNSGMTWGDFNIEPGYFLLALDTTRDPLWVSQSPRIPQGLFRIADIMVSGGRIYSQVLHQGPTEFPDTSYYVKDKVLILRHDMRDGRLVWFKEFGEAGVYENAQDILVSHASQIVSSGSFWTELQNYTYLDTILVIDQYPFGFGQWHYIGVTGPDTLRSTRIHPELESRLL